MKYNVGIDIGGMSIKVGIVNTEGEIVAKQKFVTSKDCYLSTKQMAKTINDLFDSINISEKDISGIGIGCPGAISSKKGIVENWTNLNWTNFKLVDELKKYFNTEIYLENDANVAILGEVMFGCAKGYNDAVMLTLGTGVGGGIIADGKLFTGGEGKGAELGHILLIKDGLPCTCGRKGCLECYASATALMNQTKEAMLQDKNSLMWKEVDGDINKVLGNVPFDCVKKGDKSAMKVVDNYVAYLSEGVLTLLNIFRPEAVIIGGGVSGVGEYLTTRIDEYCKERFYGMDKTPIPKFLIATLGNDAGIIGASCLAMK